MLSELSIPRSATFAMDESLEPLLLVIGGDALVERVCAELTATAGHQVRVAWSLDAKREHAFRSLGVTVTSLDPRSDDSLRAAGVMEAASLLALSEDDGLNLSIGLRARNLNPKIRVVLRQFNVTLGEKLEQVLADCTTLSPAVHSAATYAASALDQGCFFGLRFPETYGALLGFGTYGASDLGVSGLTVGQAEERLDARIVAVDTRSDPPRGAIIGRHDTVVTFGRVHESAGPKREPNPDGSTAAPRRGERSFPSSLWPAATAAFHRANPILRTFAILAVLFFSASYCYFHFALGKTWLAAAFYVTETMTNVGFGEVGVTQRGPAITLGAITAMLGGIVFTSIFIGSVASALTRAQWNAMQGLRRIRARKHVVICGGGKIGTAVLNLLTAAGKRVIVIEPNPDADLVRRARERDVDLLTGDASQAGCLDMCAIPHASAVLALTNSDETNLEIALGARVRSQTVPLVVRMEDASFANATSSLFGLSTFSPAALSAPVLAGLSRFPGTRGRVRYADDDFTVGQREQGEHPERPPAPICTALFVWRHGYLKMIRDFEEMQPFDTVLFSVPLSQFRTKTK
jgi:Trk K+ transport system NAD-binding subunit